VVGDGDARVSGTGAVRRGGGDNDGGREARRRFGGKRPSAHLEGARAYIEPPPFVTGHFPNRD
jgi:hypothetical protein